MKATPWLLLDRSGNWSHQSKHGFYSNAWVCDRALSEFIDIPVTAERIRGIPHARPGKNYIRIESAYGMFLFVDGIKVKVMPSLFVWFNHQKQNQLYVEVEFDDG